MALEVTKYRGAGNPIDVKIIDVLHGAATLSKLTEISDDGFDPVFEMKFKKGSKWILRIRPRDSKKWEVEYYETSHLELANGRVKGEIFELKKVEEMAYSKFKKILPDKLVLPRSLISGEYYEPAGFIPQSKAQEGGVIVALEVTRYHGLGGEIDVKVTDVLYGKATLTKLTKVHEGLGFTFNSMFKKGTKWILRIRPGTDDKQQWEACGYHTSYLELIKGRVKGNILMYTKEGDMAYSDFKKLLLKELVKRDSPNKKSQAVPE